MSQIINIHFHRQIKKVLRQKVTHIVNRHTINTGKSCNSHEFLTYFSLKTVFKVFLHV